MSRICPTLLNNGFLLFGVALGFFLTLNLNSYTCNNAQEENLETIFHSVESQTANRSRVAVVKSSKDTKLIRPRYYSTELGIREKLFVGVLSSEERIFAQAVHVNKTIDHLVDKTKFFITASQNLRNKFKLSGIVGFTDTRRVYRPFQIIKYVTDNFAEEYDYYYLMHDYNYLDARKLKSVVEGISVGLKVYMGTPVKDGSYCDLRAGVLFSNSVIDSMKDNLDWCVRNAVSDDDSENLGRCVYRSTKLNCQSIVQGKRIGSFKLKSFDLSENLKMLDGNDGFKEAVTVYPVVNGKDFYLLHAYFSKEHLKDVRRQINGLSDELEGDSWPEGRRRGSKPLTRFDLPNTYYFNMTHVMLPDDFTNLKRHTQAELTDIEKIISTVTLKVTDDKPGDFRYSRLINGYRTFQLSRGLDYELDLAFMDLHTGREVVKRFEVCKPLGGVEFITKPYMTENTKVHLIVPVEQSDVKEAKTFLSAIAPNVLDRREKVVVLFVLLYQNESLSKGDADPFKDVKELSLELSKRYRSEDTKVSWLSVRLPFSEKPIGIADHPSVYFGLIDLSMKKFGINALYLTLDVYSTVTVEFLNRVRMNTISGFQVFSPIPFRQYDPRISQTNRTEVHKNVGQFDREEYKYVSFYGKDYVIARKQYQAIVPIVKTDLDMTKILDTSYKGKGNPFEMFTLYSDDNVHKMRATEPGLFVRYHDQSYNGKTRRNLFFGSKSQLAKIALKEL